MVSKRLSAVSLVIVVTVFLGPSRTAQAGGETPSVLVMPFESDESQPRTYWLGEGASILVIEGLLRGGTRTLARDQRAQAFEELRLPATASLSRATAIRVAQLVGVTDVVFGVVSLEGPSIVISARSLAMDEGRLRPAIVERGPVGEIFSVGARVARRLAADLGEHSRPADDKSAGPEVPLEAFEAYVKGIIAETPDARERLLRAALERAPGYDRALLGIWSVETELGRHQAALDAARAVSLDSPSATRARFSAALSLIDLQRYEEAYETLSSLTLSRPDPAVFNNLGVVQLRRGATAQSGLPVAYFNRAAELDPDDPDLFFNLGYAYLLARDHETAAYWLRQAVRRDPADDDAHYALAAALHASGAEAEATRERELARGLSSKYEEWERRRQTGEAVPRGLERMKPFLETVHLVRFDRALMTAAQKDQREMAGFYADRARRLYDQHKDGEAIGELRRALFLAPYDPAALLLLARAHLRLGQLGEAANAARVALWSEPSVAGHVVLAEALLELKDPAGARAELDRALQLDPASTDAKQLLSRLGGGNR